MYNSVNLMTLQLESQMFEKLCESVKTASNYTPSVSFSDMLDSSINGLSGAIPEVSGQTSDAGGMTVSDNMVKFIEEHEGFASTAYRGVDSWNQTTGYGHVITAGENIGPLTQAGAESLLRNDLKKYEASVNEEFKGVNLTQGQFDALTSFAYNLGENIWSKTPKLVSDIKSGASADVIKADMENCAHCNGQVLQGLVNRRMDEWKVYAYGDYNG
ncbi:MAG TPA: lysozyme [Ruminiclostridium sp.]|nr:lysozyme [Ruminiclostridium sp.]